MKPTTFLIIEDDDVDMMSIERSFKKLRLKNPTKRALDGVDALEILHGSGTQSPLEKPYILFLDLNMPRLNGLDFLKKLRDHEETKDARVFVLTTSDTDFDISEAYAQNVNGYIVKSDLTESLRAAFDESESDWVIVG